ncbi:hypothetical protein K450DRAFT_263038 [Umbelopsis ramanniana AG]|uniref:Uncharacterized protein n=1 Tax=Umbelopsis ramanniana AG TaxID=1314678 RepID=A0AAD5H7Q0_UMBRA|nr:uncharacterized protein K450DRAFT_263038 [Umbelopsis ramanniana AG]KAI8575177.1 hypothetical protein K450DRAFT_263038 [Umbelopsis ramanniana AG]
MKKKVYCVCSLMPVCMYVIRSLVVSFLMRKEQKKNEGKQLISAAHFCLFWASALRAISEKGEGYSLAFNTPHVTHSSANVVIFNLFNIYTVFCLIS